jgi:hypothetical protein
LEVAASNLTTAQYAFDYLLTSGDAVRTTVKWGKGYRGVVVVGDKNYQYRGGNNMNEIAQKFLHYIEERQHILKVHIQKITLIVPEQRTTTKTMQVIRSLVLSIEEYNFESIR